MNILRACLALALLLGLSAVQSAPLKNTLRGHASPYLAQHGSDPVAWQEWSAATVARAKRENKLLFVSVGYFACHWCPVMQREGYRGPAIAALLNQHFIPVKVDRELNGALDAALIDFTERLKGVSGWPLNVFVTPEGYPAYAVLYTPPGEFKRRLTQINQTWRTQNAAFRDAAREAGQVDAVQPDSRQKSFTPDVSSVTAARAQAVFLQAVWQNADTLQGGFSRVSEFPMPVHVLALLEIHARAQGQKLSQQDRQKLADYLTLTLDQMASHGLRDAVHGGFFRYTTDPDWQTPHFEKMLYDNAQLAWVFARAAQVLKRPQYRVIAEETLDWVLTTLAAPGGGFYTATSALDAQGREGGAYLWQREALQQVLGKALPPQLRQQWKLDSPAPFEHGYLPQAGMPETVRLALLQAGKTRNIPRDTKINTGLNGLLLSAFSLAGQGVPRFENAAHQLQQFLITRMLQQGQLLRARAGQQVFKEAELDDYAYLASGLADYARVFKRPKAKQLATGLARTAWQRFYDEAGWRLQAQPLLATRQPAAAWVDGALPAPAWRVLAVSDTHPARDAALASGLAALWQSPFDHPGGVLLLIGMNQ